MAKKGDWVMIHSIVLEAKDRAPQVPDDTKQVPLEKFVRGFLQEDAEIGDIVKVKTVADRHDQGKLVEVHPTHRHGFGEFVPEILRIDQDLRKALFGGEE
ncbi:2-amino-4-oxopentanoate thiolase subunit OrtA [Bacillus tuaregi]|uniref:2-amino-4-oxopentanoate thiolase subunit OrtA n=1 Tax=Bacillus tuaregi TaxID=1816695 RepID=UPI0008F83A35|nr:2-amino-4-oxopentanoate thiolase subunit OrtA [Bacillus tuaregi]